MQLPYRQTTIWSIVLDQFGYAEPGPGVLSLSKESLPSKRIYAIALTRPQPDLTGWVLVWYGKGTERLMVQTNDQQL